MGFLEISLLFETRNQLIEEISGLNSPMMDYKASPESWSIAQICHHLFLSETVFTEAIVRGLKDETINRSSKKTST